MKMRTKEEMRLYQRARRRRLCNTRVTPKSRRVIRTEGWMPPPMPTEEKLLAKIKEVEQKYHSLTEEASDAEEKARKNLRAYYQSLGITDPEQAISESHLKWIERALRRELKQNKGPGKVKKAERERIQKIIDRAYEIEEERYPEPDYDEED